MLEEVVLAEPRGFCAGVDRAIEIVERALQKFGAPIYVRHEIVHNTYVVDDLKKKGAIFIEDLAEVPPGATLIFSAHGVSQAVRHEAAERGFHVYDATCPLVSKVHIEVAKLARELARGPTYAFGLAKKLFLHSTQESLETQMELEAQAIAATGHSEDFRTGVNAFAKKLGVPDFTGR